MQRQNTIQTGSFGGYYGNNVTKRKDIMITVNKVKGEPIASLPLKRRKKFRPGK